METEGLAVTTRIARKNDGRLPRGIHRRGKSLVVSFALAEGAIERRSLGPVSTSYAQEQLGIFKRQVREGTYQKRQPRPEPVKEITCSDLWTAYKKNCETREVKRMDRLALAWKHLEPVFGVRPASAVKPREIADYIAARRSAGIAPATCNRELAVLKSAFRVGADLEMIEGLPKFPKKLKEPRPRQGFLEESQYKILSKNASELWLRTFLAIGFSYGWRKSEMLSLRVRNVDLLDGWLTLETSKNDEGRRVKLTAEIKTLLADCIRGKQPDDFVLTHENGSQVSQPRKNWYSLCAVSGLGKLSEDGQYRGLQMLDLRRSAVRRLVPEKVCMAISGHKTRSMFDRYNITNERDLETAARLLDGQTSPFRSETDTKTDTSGFARA
jgi:integrase